MAIGQATRAIRPSSSRHPQPASLPTARAPGSGDPPHGANEWISCSMNSCVFLTNIARRFPSHRALMHGTETITYQEFHERALTRSEEHTSELQSRGHLVCRLLLEK